MSRRRLSAKERREIWNKTNRRCGYCGARVSLEEMQVDHMRPLARGGSNRSKNLICSCPYCNEYKAARSVEQFRHAVKYSVTVLENESLAYRNATRFGLIRKTNNGCEFYFERIERKRKERWKPKPPKKEEKKRK